jgi:hypothetical protein
MKYLKKYEKYTSTEINSIFNYNFGDWDSEEISLDSIRFTLRNDIDKLTIEGFSKSVLFIAWIDKEGDECVIRVKDFDITNIKRLLDFSIILKESYFINELLQENKIKTRIEFFSSEPRTLEELEEIVKKVDELKVKYDYILNADNLGLL